MTHYAIVTSPLDDVVIESNRFETSVEFVRRVGENLADSIEAELKGSLPSNFSVKFIFEKP